MSQSGILSLSNFQILKDYTDRKGQQIVDTIATNLNTDLITESSPGSGVTVDGVLLRDGQIQTTTAGVLTDVYAMDQPIRTTDAVTFATVNTGHGNNELYAMDQDVRTTDTPTFVTQILTGVAEDAIETKLLVLDSVSNEIKWRSTNSLTSADTEVITQLGTGVMTGGIISINVDTTKYDVTAGSGVIVNATNGTKLNVTWSAFTAQTFAYAGHYTYLSITSVGALDPQSTPPTRQYLRDNIYLGYLKHRSAPTIEEVQNMQHYVGNIGNQLEDLFDAIGPFNASGNVLSASGANLKIAKSAGTIMAHGINYQNNTKNPHILSLNGFDTGVANTFIYTFQDDSESAAITDIIPNILDNGTAYPGITFGATEFGTHRVYMVRNTMRIIAPQTAYPTLAEAFDAIATESIIEPSCVTVEPSVLIGYIITRGNATNLSNSAEAQFYQSSKFGSGTSSGGSGVATLQGAYDNSTFQPEIITNNTLGAVNIRRGSAADTDDLLTFENGVGSTVGGIKGTGAATFTSVNTGQGDYELYAMNQDVQTTDTPTFVSTILSGVANDDTENRLLVLDTATNTVQYRNVSSLPNPFDQPLNTTNAVTFASVDTGFGANDLYPMNQPVQTTDAVVFASVNTGQGANQLYAMNQPVRTSDSVTFSGQTLTGILNDNTNTKILTLNTATNVVQYRTVASLPNPFDQPLNTTDAVTFSTVNTGQGNNELYAMDQPVRTTDAVVFASVDTGHGANELYPMNQPVQTTDSPTFVTQTLTGVTNLNTNTKLLTINPTTNVIQYRTVASLPNPFDQPLNTTDAVTFSTVNTGQGNNELYAMNQPVQTTDAVVFATVNTGQGANELYPMNQPVQTTDTPTFVSAILSGVVNDDTENKLLVLDTLTNTIQYRNVSSLPNPFDQPLNTTNAVTFATVNTGQGNNELYAMDQPVRTTDAVVFASVDTGHGANELYPMDQPVQTTDTPTFASAILTTVVNDNTQTKLLVLDSITNTIEYRTVASLPNPFNQSLNTGDAVTFSTVNTGQGNNELYAMDQNVQTTDSPTFVTGTLTGVALANTNTKLLTINSTTNLIEYRTVASLPNPFNQSLNTTDPVAFASVNTGQGANLLYAMNQNVRTTDPVSFASVNTGQGANLLYAMNQPVRTSDSPTFVTATLSTVVSAPTNTKLLTINAATNLIEYRDISTLPNQFDQPLNTTDAVTFATVNTGQGNNELYAMNQPVQTTDAVVFASVDTGHGPNELYAMNQPVQTTDAVVFASVDTGQGANSLYAMNQPVQTTDAVTFASVDTGQGANSLYAMDQDVQTTDSPTFVNTTFTGVTEDAAETKVLFLDSVTNNLKFRNVSGIDGIDSNSIKQQSTGVLSGGVLSINIDPTKFDISNGSGIIVNATTGVKTNVSWTGLTAQTFVLSGTFTYVTIDSVGAVNVSTSEPDYRSSIYLGMLSHFSLPNISNVKNEQLYIGNTNDQVKDLSDALGYINVDGGNRLASATLLTFQKSSGVIFKFGYNFKNDTTDPHKLSLAAVNTNSGGTFRYIMQNNTVSGSLSNITPNILDNGTNYPGTTFVSTSWGAQRVYLLADNSIFIQPPQSSHTSAANASINAPTEAFVVAPGLARVAIFIGYIVVRGGATDLTSSADASFY